MTTGTSDLVARVEHDLEGWEVVLPLNPVPAARPRVGKYGTYYPKTYAMWKGQAKEILEELRHVPTTDETVYVSVTSVIAKPPTGKLEEPRGDTDNYAKAALDAVTASNLIWEDDKQVKTLIAHRRYAVGDEQPHTHVRVGLTLGVVWLMEPILDSEDIMDMGERVEFPEGI